MSVLGTFSDRALAAYSELAQNKYREKKVVPHQGTEQHDNHGVGETDHSFIDTDQSMDRSDYSEWDFARCIRSDGSMYGIADGKKCRKGTETKELTKSQTAKEKRSEGIRKRGERSLKRATAERVLDDLKEEGRQEREAKKQREAAADARGVRRQGGYNSSRTQRIQSLIGLAQRRIDRLQAAIARTKEGPYKAKIQKKIARLSSIQRKLQKEKGRLEQAAPRRSEGFGNMPESMRGSRD